MSTKSPLDKVDLIFKMFMWTQVLIITVAICIPSIIISLQYSGDECVIKNGWNIKLDEWLLVAALFQIVSIISFLPTVCCIWKHCCSKLIPLIFIILLTAWAGIGVFVIAESNLSTCTHDSLFVMSVIEAAFIFISMAVYTFIQIYSCCYCNCCNSNNNNNNINDDTEKNCNFCGLCSFGRTDSPQRNSNSDNDNEDDLNWFRQQSIKAFTVSPFNPDDHTV